MKLLFVVNVDWFFVSHRLPIGLEAISQGYEVHIATTFTKEKEILREYGFHTHDLNIERSNFGYASILTLFFGMLKLFWRVRPDVVHLVTIKPVLIGGLATFFSPVRGVVYAISGLGYIFTTKGMLGSLRRIIVSIWYALIFRVKNMRIIFQNSSDREILSKIMSVPDNKVVMIAGSGVDLNEYSYKQMPIGKPIVIMAARLLRSKGVYEYIEAANIIHTRGIQCQFWLVGSPDIGNPESITEAETQRWANDSSIKVLGHRSDIALLMSQASICVLPSYYGEGLPKVLIEAAASGRPVITTNMPGCRDAILPGITGLMIPPKNPLALVEAIEQLLKDDSLRNSMSRASRKFALSKFDIKDVVKKHIEIYKNLNKL